MIKIATHIIIRAEINNLSAISSDLDFVVFDRIERYENVALKRNIHASNARISSAKVIKPFFSWAIFRMLMTVRHMPTMVPAVDKICESIFLFSIFKHLFF